MSAPATDNVMLIGPTRAGKTTLLSVLRLASARRLRNDTRVRVRPAAGDANSRELFERALDIAVTGSIVHPPNVAAVEYKFELECDVERQEKVVTYDYEPGKWPWSPKVQVERVHYRKVKEPKTFNLTVVDGKGGDIFADPEEGSMEDPGERAQRRARLVQMASQSSGLIICVNTSNSESTGHFFRGLQKFLDEVQASGVRIPFARVSIALTQADRRVEPSGSSAQAELEALDPAAEAVNTLGFFAHAGLFQALDRTARKQVYAGWVSVYGFMPNEGSVNYDSANNRIAIFNPKDAKWTNDWVPYGVIEPFLFACTGEAAGLRPVPEPAD